MTILKLKKGFHSFKYWTDKNEVDIKKILISDKAPDGKKSFKYFIGYKDDDKNNSLCAILTEMSGYVICFDETKYMSFRIKDY